MFPQTSAVRRAKKGLADSRAMAEQHERYNPVNPKKELMTNYTGMGHCVGGSATPSMGLSQYRGGKHTLKDHLENPNKGYGKKKPSEAHMMGQHLSKHIHELHGAGFWSDFGDGFKQGFMGVMKPALAVGSMIPGQIGMASQLASGGLNALGLGKSEEQRAVEQMSKKRLGRSRNKSDVPLLSGNINGNRGGSRMVGGANTGAYEGHGLHEFVEKAKAQRAERQMKQKRVVGAGVSARASLVKKVMAEQGLNMIQASKYVKEHNLYNK